MLHIEPLQRPFLEVLAPGAFGAFRATEATRGEATEVRVMGEKERITVPFVSCCARDITVIDMKPRNGGVHQCPVLLCSHVTRMRARIPRVSALTPPFKAHHVSTDTPTSLIKAGYRCDPNV